MTKRNEETSKKKVSTLTLKRMGNDKKKWGVGCSSEVGCLSNKHEVLFNPQYLKKKNKKQNVVREERISEREKGKLG
jgi:hypothetical protein